MPLNFGGSYIEHADQQYTVRGLGRAENEQDLGNIVVSTAQGVPVLLKQVANIAIRPLPRHGAVMRPATRHEPKPVRRRERVTREA